MGQTNTTLGLYGVVFIQGFISHQDWWCNPQLKEQTSRTKKETESCQRESWALKFPHLKDTEAGQAPIILATQEAEIRRITV
jgi:hypothetical protein